MHREIKVGDRVKYKSSFLKNIGWHTDVPKFGVVVWVFDDSFIIDWDEWKKGLRVLRENIILEDIPDYF